MTTYLVGYNRPGYLPDGEPVEFDNLDEAHTYLVERVRSELEWTEEHHAQFGGAAKAVQHNREALAEVESLEPQEIDVYTLDPRGYGHVIWLGVAL